MKVLVCGGRDYSDRRHVCDILDAVHAANSISLLIAGGATGADALAIEWARSRSIPQLIYPADWEGLGRRAGPIRNQKMLDEGKPHVAFRGGRGTADMVRRAVDAGVHIHRPGDLDPWPDHDEADAAGPTYASLQPTGEG